MSVFILHNMNTIGITIAWAVAAAVATATIPPTAVAIAVETIRTTLTREKINPTSFL